MKFRGLQFLLSTAAAVLLCSYILYESDTAALSPGSEASDKDKLLLKVLMQSLKSNHYEPKDINDAFSENAFSLYLDRLDNSKRFLLKQDVAAMEEYKQQLDDQIKASDFKFFELSHEIFQKRLKEASGYYEEILSEPFDFEKDESLELDGEKRDFLTTREELKDHWRKLLKYRVLARISEMDENQEKALAESDTVTAKSFEEMEVKARESIKKSNDRFFERMSKWDRDDLKEVYINSIVNVFCPHTGYFPPKDKENFDISMSGQLEGIGAQLQERDGYIRVTNIVPGSASYRQGDLQEGDLILKVGQGKEEPVDVTDMRLDDAVKLIRGKKGTEVRLTIKKINGTIEEISIIRDIVILAETYAKSAVIENKNGVKVGYIYLPKFYADFNKLGGRSAADDVKKELQKLKAEEVEGIVLDLRGNGGGSLRDAIEMTGHFIPNGPVVQVKSRYGQPEIMSDNNGGVVYDGPLLVMMNHFSASASEILAAAIQDYDRGIIMGANSSFGKGTVQRFIELDRMITPNYSQYRPLGAVKITTQKFYRINGDATQLKGVTPDIVTPDQYNYVEMGEKEQEYVMPWDEIERANYKVWKPTYNESKIVANSQGRIKSSEVMSSIDENSHRLHDRSEETLVSLKYDEFVSRQKILSQESDEFNDLFKPIDGLEVNNVSSDFDEISQDSVKLDLNEKWMKKLRKDVFLDEALNVINDMQQGA